MLPWSRDPVARHQAVCAPDESCEAPSFCQDLVAASVALKERTQAGQVVVVVDEGAAFVVDATALHGEHGLWVFRP